MTMFSFEQIARIVKPIKPAADLCFAANHWDGHCFDGSFCFGLASSAKEDSAAIFREEKQWQN
jgi:hypothetical protein